MALLASDSQHYVEWQLVVCKSCDMEHCDTVAVGPLVRDIVT
jgi:hypothetical protein